MIIKGKTKYKENKEIEIRNLGKDILFVYCSAQYLTEIDFADNNVVKELYCNYNYLTQLNLPDSIEILHCWDNPLKEITLPKNIKTAIFPLNCNVLNLDEFKNRKDIMIYFLPNDKSISI